MKKFIVLSVQLMTAVIIILEMGFTAKATALPAAAPTAANGKLGKHNKAVYCAIKQKLNITDKDIENAKSEGKSAFQLASDRGVGEDELREYIIKEAWRSVDRVVVKGLMPKYFGDKIKGKVKASIENWDGYFR